MSGESSSVAAWSSLLEPVERPTAAQLRADDPRLEDIIEFWTGSAAAVRPGRAVLLGFPQDEGVRRNDGRIGAAKAPRELRPYLWRLTPWDPDSNVDLGTQPPLDIGDVHCGGSLEESQEALAQVVAALLQAGAVPIILGGGHETAFGHYLGYIRAGKPVAIINIDAHLDVRPLLRGKGHSGSPFRQALEHPTHPLPGPRYACLGMQPGSVAREHHRYATAKGCTIITHGNFSPAATPSPLLATLDRLSERGHSILLTMDADAFHAADVPAVSAPNADGLPGVVGLHAARSAGRSPHVGSFELVEINPRFDRDGQSLRWAAWVVWNFLVGLGQRPHKPTAPAANP